MYSQVVARAYKLYQEQLEANQALDFDDLIMKTIELFEQDPETLEILPGPLPLHPCRRYQDTNDAQYKLVHMLADKYENICVVGDADQYLRLAGC